MLNAGLKLLVIILTINAVLFVSGITNDQEMFSFIPQKYKTYFEDITTSGTDYNVAMSKISTSSSPSGLLELISSLFGALSQIIDKLLFGYFIAMFAAGIPMPIILIIGVPIAAIQIITLFYLTITAIGAIRGLIGL